ncbi:tetratricopeptide repeat protein [Actinomadura rubrisoli]|uniref:Tetratricopeptide repeat protein n=1 Tax=Actinomadura rubrisoli TaxID=2530368 RepID=A0A4R5C7M6_9ACTN|nr:tetratricopeptide repeat protein [Actinomadura rubrisoli]TDD95115.1 tetratricopeptide repeat protein [Actinomadura rubrisoli]
MSNELSGSQVIGTAVQAGSIGTLNLSAHAPPPVLVPRQLPAALPGFVNRADEMAQLDELLAELNAGPRVVVVSGLGGVGKTGLGVHWAARAGSRFEGGHLYADLGARRHGGGVEVGDVLADFLRALGVGDEWIPAGLAERGSLYRSVVADRKIFVLLDNVDQPAQVIPLVPGSPGSVVIVTSRRRLTGLLVSGARPVHLEPLDTGDGVRLIGEMLSDGRVDDEPEAAAELVRLCGGLPIALRVCAARLAGRRVGLAGFSAELADERRRMTRLAVEGVSSVSAVFDAAYADLPEEAAALYRGLGAHPGPEFSLEAMAVAGGVGRDEAARLAETLLEAVLLEELGDGRYRFHDLVRLHARERAEAGGEHLDVRRRIVEWYLGRARAADQAVLGGRLRLAEVTVDDEAFAGSAAAIEWLDLERINLVAAVRAAAEHRWDDLVWWFGEALWALYDNRAHHADELEVARLAARAARDLGDAPARTRMLNQVVRALLRAGDLDAAAAELPGALEAAARCGHRRVESAVLESAGLVRQRQGDHEGAIELFRRSQAINAEMDNPRGVALQAYHLAGVLIEAGRYAEAVAELGRAMPIMVTIQDRLSQGKIGVRLGDAYLRLGRRPEARAALHTAVQIMEALHMPLREARALELLADATEDEDADSAERYRRRARSLRAAVDTTGT